MIIKLNILAGEKFFNKRIQTPRSKYFCFKKKNNKIIKKIKT